MNNQTARANHRQSQRLGIAFLALLTVLTIATGATTVGLFVYLKQTKPQATIAKPENRVEPSYAGNATSYRVVPASQITPVFKAKLNREDWPRLVEHLDNVAAQRHWAPRVQGYRYREYVLPDHDVELLREIASQPHDWAARNRSYETTYAPTPEPGRLMVAGLRHELTQKREGPFTGAVMGSFVTLCMLLVCLMAYSVILDF